jgi:hypothetical protein
METIAYLVASAALFWVGIVAGIDASERLLFMSSVDIGKLKDIKPVTRREIDAYRSRFVGLEATLSNEPNS